MVGAVDVYASCIVFAILPLNLLYVLVLNKLLIISSILILTYCWLLLTGRLLGSSSGLVCRISSRLLAKHEAILRNIHHLRLAHLAIWLDSSHYLLTSILSFHLDLL